MCTRNNANGELRVKAFARHPDGLSPLTPHHASLPICSSSIAISLPNSLLELLLVKVGNGLLRLSTQHDVPSYN